jgi:hypothetical protein
MRASRLKSCSKISKEILKKRTQAHVVGEIRKIVANSPVKPNFTEEQILESYLYAIDLSCARGVRRKHILFTCAFWDVLDDPEKREAICDYFEVLYGDK